MATQFFQTPKPKSFNFKPRYYSEEKERVEELKKQLSVEEITEEQREQRMRDAFQRKAPRKDRKGTLNPLRLFIYIVLIGVLILVLINASILIR